MITPSSITRLRPRGLTLVEILVTFTILSAILMLTSIMVSSTSESIKKTKSDASQFREAYRAFETMTQRVSQATLNTYWDYDNPDNPKKYSRQSELHFVSGDSRDLLDDEQLSGKALFFVAPFGYTEQGSVATNPYRNLKSLLNAWGYYVSYLEDPAVPQFVKDKSWYRSEETSRFRLIEYRQSTEQLSIYSEDLREPTLTRDQAYHWFRHPVDATQNQTNTRVVADNILAIIIRPVKSIPEGSAEKPWDLSPNYLYDSRERQWGSEIPRTTTNHNQLPPLLEISLIAVDEPSWKRYIKQHSGTAPQTRIGNRLNALFQDSAEYEGDLDALRDFLQEEKLNARVISATIPMRTAKWSDY